MIQLLALTLVALAAQDTKDSPGGHHVAPVGTTWEGTYKAVEISVSSTGKRSTKRVHADVRITVEERKGDKFTGEFWLDNNKKGFAIAGTVDTKGNLAFTFTKKLKGTWPSDMIDNAQVRCLLRKNELVGRFTKGGNETIVADIVAKEKKGE